MSVKKECLDDVEDGRQFMTLSNALDKLGWGPFHWRLMVQCGFSWACDGIEIMLLSFLVPNIIGTVFLQDASDSKQDLYAFLLGAVTFGGILIGSVFFGFTSDMYGRRNCYFVSTAVIAAFGLICTASPNIETLIALRFIVGLGLGGVTCSFTLLSEVVGQAHRGKKIILSMGLLWTLGCILAAVTAWICFTLIPSINWQWKAYIILAAVPSLTLLALFPWMIESPRFHLKEKNEEKAIRTLRIMALKNKLEPSFPENLRLKNLPEEASKAKQWMTLFNKKYRLSTCIIAGLWFLNMGAYYGICFVTPLYFKALHDNEYLAAFISSCSEVPGILASSWLVDHAGRKHTLMIMYSICTVFTVLMGLSDYLPFPALVVMAVFSRGSAMGAIMTLYLYTPEVYPTHARNLALGLGSAVSRVSGIITSYLSFSSSNAPMASTAIFIYAGAVLVCDLITFFLPFETKDKVLDDGNDKDAKDAKECSKCESDDETSQ